MGSTGTFAVTYGTRIWSTFKNKDGNGLDPGSPPLAVLWSPQDSETILPKKSAHLEDLMLLGDECQISVLSTWDLLKLSVNVLDTYDTVNSLYDVQFCCSYTETWQWDIFSQVFKKSTFCMVSTSLFRVRWILLRIWILNTVSKIQRNYRKSKIFYKWITSTFIFPVAKTLPCRIRIQPQPEPFLIGLADPDPYFRITDADLKHCFFNYNCFLNEIFLNS